MFSTNRDLASYYAALDLPKSMVKEFSLLVDKWVQHNGVDWSVSRLKTIYNDFVRYRAGLPLVGTWYSKNKSGLPRGVLSRIFKMGIQSKRRRFSCSVLLRVYTRFISKEPTPTQLDKFLKGVSAEDVIISDDIIDGVAWAGNIFYGEIWCEPNQPSFISFTPSPGKRVPLSNGRTAPEESHWQSQWETIVNTKTGRILEAKYPRIFSKVFSGFTRERENCNAFAPYGIDTVGKIGLIQEPGFKLRAVANPNRVYQVALKPLGDAIYGVLEKAPWDCTFNQERAKPAIMRHLQARSLCHCIDLTGATDYFPLSIQLNLLKSLFRNLDDYIDLFEDLSRSNWTFQDTTIRWTKGQPLGLYPSFGSFALTHGLLLYYLNNFHHNDEFFVLGDDVVILNDSLASKYKECLSVIGCPISEHKSLSSTIMAEFGGKLIFADHFEPQLKWRQLSDDNFLDITRLLGVRSLRLLRPQQRKVVKAIWDIPDFVGGLGFNPDGIPLEKRYEKYLDLFGEDVSTYLMSYDRKFNKFFYEQVELTNKVRVSQKWDSLPLPDLDQKSAALVSKYLPLFNKWYGIMGTNLYSISRKGVLPIDGGTGRRQTLLATIMSKLRM